VDEGLQKYCFRLALVLLTACSLPAAEVSQGSALPAARGLLERWVPKQAGQFVLETIPTEGGDDVFEIESRGGKVILRGNNGVSLASALNWYLQKECHCDISWNCGDQLKLPKPLPEVRERIQVV
jgi:alpha-N-acetylglucosaminidase